MNSLSAGRLLAVWGVSATGWLVVAFLCLFVGSTGDVGWPGPGYALSLRTDRVLLASLVGAGLAVSGVGYQAVLRNALAEPFLLGVAGGAALTTYLWYLPGSLIAASPVFLALGQQAAAFVGAIAAIAVVLLLAGSGTRLEPVRTVLVGVIVNVVCGSVFILVTHLFPLPGGRGSELMFLVGELQTNLTPTTIAVAATIVGLGTLALAAGAPWLNVVRLGEDEAAAMGLRVARVRWMTLIISSLVTAAAVAVSGPIGFVGLIAPHAGRMIVGPDNRRLLPVAAAGGAILLAAADAAVRLLSQQTYLGTILPVGVVTGLLGGPFFLLLLARRPARV